MADKVRVVVATGGADSERAFAMATFRPSVWFAWEKRVGRFDVIGF
jgi:hypothetical protein